MSILRFDLTTKDWVIFAPDRSRRPRELEAARASSAAPPGPCPFCPGNERLTPAEIYAVRSGDRWRVRVVPNRYPVLRIEDEATRYEDGRMFQSMGGCGAHEVIIESPDHDLSLAEQPVEQVELVLATLHARFNDLLRDGRFQTIVVFKNHGETAGTSLRHPHWQLVATPVVPRLLRIKHLVAAEYFDATGHCLYCDILEAESAAKARVIASNDQYVAILPFASHLPFETWILPRHHESSFGRAPRDRLGALATLLKQVLAMLNRSLDNPDFNVTLHTAPRGDEDKKYFLWHLCVLPRLSVPAGFEIGSGMSINTVLPEDAAKHLRELAA